MALDLAELERKEKLIKPKLVQKKTKKLMPWDKSPALDNQGDDTKCSNSYETKKKLSPKKKRNNSVTDIKPKPITNL